MDALILTLESTGWRALPLGPWAIDLGEGPSSHLSPSCTHIDEVLRALASRVPPHVVITVEYAS